MFAAGLLVIALAPPRHAKSGAVVEPSRRLVMFLDFEEHGAHPAACKTAEMRQQQITRQPAAATAGLDRDRENFRLVRRDARHREADDVAALPQAINLG